MVKQSPGSKSKRICGFGSCAERFGSSALHPGLDRLGLFQPKSLGCDPALYSPIPIKKAFEVNKKHNIVPWAYEAALHEWALNLGYRNQKILKRRAYEKAALGPAWHELKEPVCGNSACENAGFGISRRFKTLSDKSLPPGLHYKAVPFRALPGPHTATPSFEWSTRCRFKSIDPPFLLAPNRYIIHDRESIEWKPKKLVSVRGPYDLFTGPRDGSLRNHFGTGAKCSAATWPLKFPGCMERILKSKRGQMKETGRDKRPVNRNMLVDSVMCYRDPKEPSPATYKVCKPRVFDQWKYGFNRASPQRMRIKMGVQPAVGRYRWKDCKNIAGHGHRHVFKSVVQRTMGAFLPKPMNSF